MLQYTLVPSTKADIPYIIELTDKHINSFNSGTFLIGKHTVNSLEEKYDDDNYLIFVLKDDTNKIVGSTILVNSYLRKNGNPENYIYFNNRYKNMLEETNRYWHIEQNAVSKELTGRGIGKELYNQLFNLFPDHYFTSNVVLHPHLNKASLKYKGPYNFVSIGIYYEEDFIGLKDFKSLLMLKEPNNLSKK